MRAPHCDSITCSPPTISKGIRAGAIVRNVWSRLRLTSDLAQTESGPGSSSHSARPAYYEHNAQPFVSSTPRLEPTHSGVEFHERRERLLYCDDVMREVITLITRWIRLSHPDSRVWSHLVGDEWDRHIIKRIVVNSVLEVKNREIKYATDFQKAGEHYRAQRHWDAGQGIAQVLSYVERGIPVLREEAAGRNLILMGNR